jgi:hypothetical protein
VEPPKTLLPKTKTITLAIPFKRVQETAAIYWVMIKPIAVLEQMLKPTQGKLPEKMRKMML